MSDKMESATLGRCLTCDRVRVLGDTSEWPAGALAESMVVQFNLMRTTLETIKALADDEYEDKDEAYDTLWSIGIWADRALNPEKFSNREVKEDVD